MNDAIIPRKDMESLLRHLRKVQEILKSAGYDEGNVFNFNDLTESEKISHILDGICEFFGVTLENLTKPRRGNNEVPEAKRFCCLFLYDYTRMTYYEIAVAIGYKRDCNVIYNYKQVKNEISGENYGYEKTRTVYASLKKHLMLP